MQIELDFTSNNCIIPRDETGIPAVNSVPELQALSKSVKDMYCSVLCSSSLEFCQEKKSHIHSGIREVPPLGFVLLQNENNSRIFWKCKAHIVPSSVSFLRKLLNLSM